MGRNIELGLGPGAYYGAAMRPFRALGLYLLAVFLGGALFAPWLYWLVQLVASTFPHLANSPFHRFVNRSLLGVAVIGVWPLFRSLGADSWRAVGLGRPSRCWRQLGAGLGLGFISLAAVAAAALGSGARALSQNYGHLGQKLLTAALSAGVVAVLEEVLFRGALFGALRKALGWVRALLLSSLIYALVHFMESAKFDGPVVWYSGLELLPRMLRGFGDWQAMLPGFLNLTLAGTLLALAYQRTGSLYFSIGLHAGWIFWLKSYGAFSRAVPQANVWLWGGAKLIDGWVATLILGGMLWLGLRLSWPRTTELPAQPVKLST